MKAILYKNGVLYHNDGKPARSIRKKVQCLFCGKEFKDRGSQFCNRRHKKEYYKYYGNIGDKNHV